MRNCLEPKISVFYVSPVDIIVTTHSNKNSKSPLGLLLSQLALAYQGQETLEEYWPDNFLDFQLVKPLVSLLF